MSDQYTTAMSNQKASATYDLLGNITSLTYPDGRVVKSTYSAAARPTKIIYDNFNGTPVNYNYLSAAHYAPDGSPANTLMGNGITETNTYNDRLQPCNQQIATGGSPWVNRTYSFYSSPTCSGSGGNNGNVMQIADNLQNGRTQDFAYDPLNRLLTAATQGTSGSDCWGNSYVYDQWANLTQQNVTQCSGPYMNLSIDGNNHITNSGFAYDADGNLTLNSPISYQYDAESRLVNFSSGAGVYTYDAEGNRVQKQAGGATTDYIYFGGQPIAEYNPATGDWSDYIYAGSRRLARADTYENGIWIQGTNDGSSSWPNTWFRLNDANYLSGTYTIQAGDYLYERQYQDNARGGMGLFFRDGTNNAWQSTDQNGNYMNDDPNQLVWDERSFNLTAFAGKVVDWIGIDTDAHTPPGAWNVVYGDIVIVSADGTVHPIYSASANFSVSLEWATGSTGVSVRNRHLSNISSYTITTTNYYHGDPLGSERLVTGYNGYPTWSATFLPFGEEWNPQSTVNHYKFTGKERDSESNLDNFEARYYSSQMGRFMSPDPSGLIYADPSNPQSLNLYSYVLNNPLKYVDPSGLYCYYGDTSADSPDWGDNSQYDFHSTQTECTAADQYGNRGTWFNDPSTTVTVNGDTGATSTIDTTLPSSVSYVTPGAQPARTALLQTLTNAGTCWAFFNQATSDSGQASPGSTFANTDIRLNPQAPVQVAGQSQQGSGSNGPIFINPNSAFFHSGGTVNGQQMSFNIGPFTGGTLSAQEAILAHELGHKTNAIPPDNGNTAQSQQNTNTVLHYCTTKY